MVYGNFVVAVAVRAIDFEVSTCGAKEVLA
jgi:hypothetical protein